MMNFFSYVSVVFVSCADSPMILILQVSQRLAPLIRWGKGGKKGEILRCCLTEDHSGLYGFSDWEGLQN